MSDARRIAWLVGAWALFLGFYAGVSFYLKTGVSLNSFGDIVQCFVPLIANAGLLINAGTPHWRRNVFWMLLALSCTMWMVGQFQWTYYEVYLQQAVPSPSAWDIIFFMRGIPLIAALTLRPYLRRGELRIGLGYMDFTLLLSWWTFLYVYAVLPWMYATPTPEYYDRNFSILTNIQFAVVMVGFAVFWWKTRGAWRIVCAHLFGASTLYTVASLLTNWALARGTYYTGSWYDLLLMTVFFWYALAGAIAFQKRNELDAPMESSPTVEAEVVLGDNVWATRFAMAAVFSLPFFALYALRVEHDTPAVRDFRVTVSLIASLPLALMVFLRTHLADADRAR